MKTIPEITVIACAYNEEENINLFLDSIIPCLSECTKSFEILFVNDGSTDKTLENITNYKHNSNIRVVNLSRNFGKELALTAGLDHCKGMAAIPIDVDMQQPIDLIPKFIDLWKQGYLNVIGVRKDRDYEGFIKRFVSNLFYKIMKKTSKINVIPNAGDYRLIDRKVINEICRLRETNRFMKGVYSFAGFNSITIEFDIEPRAFGRTKWNFFKLWNYSLDAIFGFSTVPLRIWSYLGLIICFFSFIFSIYLVFKTLILGIEQPGYTTTVLLILFFGGIQLISVGVLGEYVGRIFDEVKKRPLYIVESIIEKQIKEND